MGLCPLRFGGVVVVAEVRIDGWTMAELEEFFAPATRAQCADIDSEPYAHEQVWTDMFSDCVDGGR